MEGVGPSRLSATGFESVVAASYTTLANLTLRKIIYLSNNFNLLAGLNASGASTDLFDLRALRFRSASVLESWVRVELTNTYFADRSLAFWVPRHKLLISPSTIYTRKNIRPHLKIFRIFRITIYTIYWSVSSWIFFKVVPFSFFN
jgi:hypothetical protein